MKARVATLWLDGCSGCHMSLLDLDHQLLELANSFELVYSPLVDVKEFPEGVDVTLVEGAVSTQHDYDLIQQVRQRSGILVSLGDCAVTGNVSALRNMQDKVLDVYQTPPETDVPELLRVRPVHQVVPVDYYLPGCQPSAKTIGELLTALLAGRAPDLRQAHFGN